MTVNIFEGSRRIVKIIALFWVAGWCIEIGSVTIKYFDAKNILSDQANLADTKKPTQKTKVKDFLADVMPTNQQEPVKKISAKEYFADALPKNKSNGIGEKLNQYPAQDIKQEAMPWDNAEVVSEIVWDTPETLAKTANESKVNNFFSTLKDDLILLFGGVLFLFISTWATGWVVRGFLGIQTGQDFKD